MPWSWVLVALALLVAGAAVLALLGLRLWRQARVLGGELAALERALPEPTTDR